MDGANTPSDPRSNSRNKKATAVDDFIRSGAATLSGDARLKATQPDYLARILKGRTHSISVI